MKKKNLTSKKLSYFLTHIDNLVRLVYNEILIKITTLLKVLCLLEPTFGAVVSAMI